VNRRLPGITQNALQPKWPSPGPRPVQVTCPRTTHALRFSRLRANGPQTARLTGTMNGPGLGFFRASEGLQGNPPWMVLRNAPAYGVDLRCGGSDQAGRRWTTGQCQPRCSPPAGRYRAVGTSDDPTVNMGPYPGTIDLKADCWWARFQFMFFARPAPAACGHTNFGGRFSPTTASSPLDGKGWCKPARKTRQGTTVTTSAFTTEGRATGFCFQRAVSSSRSNGRRRTCWVFVNGQLTPGHRRDSLAKTAGQFTLANNGVATVCVENLAPVTGVG